ncbi:MAG: hypothetical protein WA728_18910 [Xanthobacteraceae bacterium]
MRLRTVALAAGLMAATIPSMTVPADAAGGGVVVGVAVGVAVGAVAVGDGAD